MQRVAFRPSVAWLLLVGLLVTSGVLTATRGGLGAFNKAATCTGYGYGYQSGYGYATPLPQLTLGLNHVAHPAGTAVLASGNFVQNGCVLPNEVVKIQRRIVVNGVPKGNWATIATVATDANGVFRAAVYSVYDSAFQAIVDVKGVRPAATSPSRILKTNIKVSAYAPSGKATTIARICGRTLPYKGGQTVTLYRYSSALAKWVPKQQTRVGTGSIYCFGVFLPKGRNAMLVSVPADTVNQRGLKFVYDYRV
jgi:hypothetical protein